jgi:hypothetical protein
LIKNIDRKIKEKTVRIDDVLLSTLTEESQPHRLASLVLFLREHWLDIWSQQTEPNFQLLLYIKITMLLMCFHTFLLTALMFFVLHFNMVRWKLNHAV